MIKRQEDCSPNKQQIMNSVTALFLASLPLAQRNGRNSNATQIRLPVKTLRRVDNLINNWEQWKIGENCTIYLINPPRP